MTSSAGAVPTHDQVHEWAQQAAKYWTRAPLFIYTLAFMGLRSSEALLLTVNKHLFQLEEGNLLDLRTATVSIHCQSSRDGAAIPPKGGKRRVVALPPSALTHGIDLEKLFQEFVDDRYIFGRSCGRPWVQNDLYAQVFAKAADDLGWKLPSYTTLTGVTRTQRRFTLHSLRARYATTAINEWGFSRAQLQQQGGWEPGTVERFYQGFDDQTLDTVHRLFRNR